MSYNPSAGYDDEDEDESSAEEMKLSRERYACHVPGQAPGLMLRPPSPPSPPPPPVLLLRRQPAAASDFGPPPPPPPPGGAPGAPPPPGGGPPPPPPPCAPFKLLRREPATASSSGANRGGSSTERRRVLRRNLEQRLFRGPEAQSTELPFKWDHYGRDFSAQVDTPGLEWVFGKEAQPPEEAPIVSNIVEDVNKLREIGFNIDYPDGLLGTGFYGSVYKGFYGMTAQQLSETDVRALQPFAVKIVEYSKDNHYMDLEKRECFETEKYIMTNVSHNNVVPIRMIINMGDYHTFHFLDSPTKTYLSPDRVYMIMDFADKGVLEDYLGTKAANLTPSTRINWIRDLFAGMLYLHRQDIIHGDVHLGNVLLYTEGTEIVAKWADFGLGYVSSNKQYRFRKPKGQGFQRLINSDVKRMGEVVFIAILKDRQKKQESLEVREILDMLEGLAKELKTNVPPLEQAFNQYKQVLTEELNFDENYY